MPQFRAGMGGRLPGSELEGPANCYPSGRISTTFVLYPVTVCSLPQGELLCEGCESRAAHYFGERLLGSSTPRAARVLAIVTYNIVDLASIAYTSPITQVQCQYHPQLHR